jgi:hypothetical protein
MSRLFNISSNVSVRTLPVVSDTSKKTRKYFSTLISFEEVSTVQGHILLLLVTDVWNTIQNN